MNTEEQAWKSELHELKLARDGLDPKRDADLIKVIDTFLERAENHKPGDKLETDVFAMLVGVEEFHH